MKGHTSVFGDEHVILMEVCGQLHNINNNINWSTLHVVIVYQLMLHKADRVHVKVGQGHCRNVKQSFSDNRSNE